MPAWTYPQLWQIVSGRLLDSEVFYILFSETRQGYREGGIIVNIIAARLTIDFYCYGLLINLGGRGRSQIRQTHTYIDSILYIYDFK